MKKALILLIVTSLIYSCKNDSSIHSSPNNECNIIQTSEGINKQIETCYENRFSTKSEIEDNLIGEWALIGIVSAWVSYEPTSICLLLSITDDSLTLMNLDTEEEFTTDWDVISNEVNGSKIFYLDSSDQELRWQVGMQFFSEKIMYGSGNADDTDTYVYEKVN